ELSFLSALSLVIEEMANGLARAINERGLLLPCFDLWEERIGVHAYSTAAIYAGLESSSKIIEEICGSEKVDAWRSAAR
ncbi:MAG: glycoside hydrolase family 15, partial [Candidatus Freyarchaeota archaeon]|nr:glycoside hydrolase family 15 [Candidatus Jordarchaeia archaeon]